MKNILWLNRHHPQEIQVMQLTELFGDINLIEKVIGFSTNPKIGADQIQELMYSLQIDEIVAVVPISHLAELVNRGIHPIRAIMKRTPTDRLNSKGEIEFDYRHEGFEKILEAQLISKRLC